jgi:hypothetical protein
MVTDLSLILQVISELEDLHGEEFKFIYDNYFLSPSGILYSYFHRKLRFVKPSYKINRNGEYRPTLRVNVNKKRVIWLQYRLTANFFSDEEIKGKQVNHLDGDVYNVHPDNLDVGDNTNNQNHKRFMNYLYQEIDRRFEYCYLNT